jgi:hypothetical protein
MNCLRKIREREAEIVDTITPEEKAEREELKVILEGGYVAEDYLS